MKKQRVATWYLKFDENQMALFWMAILTVVVFFGSFFLFFWSGIKEGYSYPLGWLLGSGAEILAFLSIIYFSKAMFGQSGSHKGTIWLSALGATLRSFLYAVVLALSALCTFEPAWLGGFAAFNFYATFLGLIPMPLIVMIAHLSAAHKGIKAAQGEDVRKDKSL